jgi:hypothetical protein
MYIQIIYMGGCVSKPCKEVDETNNEMETIDKQIAEIYAEINEKYSKNDDYDSAGELLKQINKLQDKKLLLIEGIQEKINKKSDLDSRLNREYSDSNSSLDLELELQELMDNGLNEQRKGGKKSRRKQTRGKKSRRKQTRGKKSRRKQKGGYTPLEEDFREFVSDMQTPETKIKLEDIDEIYPPGELDELLRKNIRDIQILLIETNLSLNKNNDLKLRTLNALSKPSNNTDKYKAAIPVLNKKIEDINTQIKIITNIIYFKSELLK